MFEENETIIGYTTVLEISCCSSIQISLIASYRLYILLVQYLFLVSKRSNNVCFASTCTIYTVVILWYCIIYVLRCCWKLKAATKSYFKIYLVLRGLTKQLIQGSNLLRFELPGVQSTSYGAVLQCTVEEEGRLLEERRSWCCLTKACENSWRRCRMEMRDRK